MGTVTAVSASAALWQTIIIKTNQSLTIKCYGDEFLFDEFTENGVPVVNITCRTWFGIEGGK